MCSTTQCDPATRPADVTEACNTQACLNTLCWTHPEPEKTCLHAGACSPEGSSQTTKCRDGNNNLQTGHRVYCAAALSLSSPECARPTVTGPTCPAGSNGICLATNDCGSGFSCQDSCCVPDTVSCRPTGHVFDRNERSSDNIVFEPRCCSQTAQLIDNGTRAMCVNQMCEEKTVQEPDYRLPFLASVKLMEHPECPCGAVTGGQYHNGIYCRAVLLGAGTGR